MLFGTDVEQGIILVDALSSALTNSEAGKSQNERRCRCKRQCKNRPSKLNLEVLQVRQELYLLSNNKE